MTEHIAPRRWFHRHPILTLSAFVLLLCVAAIIVAESAARLFIPQWITASEERGKFWAYDELLGWEHLPNQRGRFNHQDFSVNVSINSQGMRDDEYPLERTAKKRMLVLGDSFGWGFGVELDERFSEILETRHTDWEIINASVSGYGTDQQYLFLREKGINFRPDVILLLFDGSDFWNNIHAEESWYFRPFFVVERGRLKLQNVPVPKATAEQRFHRFLARESYFGPKVYLGLWWLKSRVSSWFKNGITAGKEKSSTDEESAYDVTYLLINAMNELSVKEGAQFFLVSVPMNEKKRTWLRKIAEKEGVPYLPLDEYFESKGGKAKFPHDIHWSARGHAIAADAIDDFLRTLGVFDASRPEQGKEQSASPLD